MSNMITSGKYRIYNALHENRFASMAGHDKHYEVVGSEDVNIIKIEVTNKVQHLVTLFDIKQKKYIHINDEHKVVGRDEPQELQLSTEDGHNIVIHKQDVNMVWVLNSGEDRTPIVAAPAPDQSVVDYKKKFWRFVIMMPGTEE